MPPKKQKLTPFSIEDILSKPTVGKTKKTRIIFTGQQISELENTFGTTKYLSSSECFTLANKIGITINKLDFGFKIDVRSGKS